MSKPSIIIIGAGLSGLSTGCYAQMNGYQCHIFEHARHPGGVAAEWKRQGYIIDGGIHFYMGFRPGQPLHDLYRELGIYQEDQYLEMTTYCRFLDPASERSLDVTQNLDQLGETMKGLSPQDAAFIDKVLKGAKTFSRMSMASSMEKPPDLTTWWDKIKMMIKIRKTLQYYSKWFMQPVHQATRDFHDPWLANVFAHLFLPDAPVVFIMMLLGALMDRNMAIRKDGSGGFARALEKRYVDLGGKVTYRATIDKILVRNNCAVGVRLDNGEEYLSDRIVSTADGFSTLYELLEGKYISKQLEEMHEKWPLWNPIVLINYGVARDFSQEPPIIVLKPTSHIGHGFFTNDWYVIRIFNYCPNCAPEGKTLVQVMLQSAWQPWKDLRDDTAAYNAEKQKTGELVLEQLDHVWPGIKNQVEMTNVATPYTWWRFTRNRRGSFEGFAVTDKIFTTQVKRTLPGLKNLYMAGHWVVPGGGVIPTLFSGRHAAMLLCSQDGRSFQTTVPDDWSIYRT